MSAQEQSQTGEPEHGRPSSHGTTSHGKPYVYSKLDEWDLDPEDIGEISGRGNARLRQLTPVRGLSGEPLDPVVEDALRDVRRQLVEDLKKNGTTIDKIRTQLASHYLNATEKVTARLNRQALPRTTRMLLAIDGMYEFLLLTALKGGVGTTPADDDASSPDQPDHTHVQAAAAAPAVPPAAEAAPSAT
jgi:hypothetical protein